MTALKFGSRSARCMLICYTESTKIWKLWDLSKQRTLRSTDIIFVENENAITTTTGDKDIFLHLSPELNKSSHDENQVNESRQASARTANEPRQASARTTNKPRQAFARTANEPRQESARTANEPRQESARTTNEPRVAKEAQHDELLRQVDDDLRRLTSSEACLAVHAHVAHCRDGNDPLTFHEAIESPLKNQWIHAMRNELSSLHVNITWDTTDASRKDGIDSKWVFKTKLNPDGSIRYKAGLVIKG